VAKKQKWPHGWVSKAQWRFAFANPRLRKTWAERVAKRARPHPMKFKSLPERKRGPSARTLRTKG